MASTRRRTYWWAFSRLSNGVWRGSLKSDGSSEFRIPDTRSYQNRAVFQLGNCYLSAAKVVGYFHFETDGDRGILVLCQSVLAPDHWMLTKPLFRWYSDLRQSRNLPLPKNPLKHPEPKYLALCQLWGGRAER
jgi:hypothetical protein